jgi:hypothetical protein
MQGVSRLAHLVPVSNSRLSDSGGSTLAIVSSEEEEVETGVGSILSVGVADPKTR